MKKILFYIFILLILFLLSGCGNEAPVISSIMYNILVYEQGSLNASGNNIFLSVYFILDDPNGLEDVQNVKITHTETEYSWIIPKDNISKSMVIWNDRKFVGSAFIEYSNADSILTGEYLVEATDSVGNIADGTFFVEIEGLQSNIPFKVPPVNYKFAKVKNNEFRITGDKYESSEIRILNNPKAYNNQRKKFKSDKNIIIDEEFLQPRTQLSVRINKNENIIYFLKNYLYE